MDAEKLIGSSNLFLCNTNRREGRRWVGDLTFFERLMFDRKHAIAWTSFKYPRRMEEVQRGDLIIMWAKEVGAIGLGQALAPVSVLGPKDKRFFTGFDKPPPPAKEWRIPVKWLAWVDESVAYPWHGEGMNFTFASVDNDTWRDNAHAAIRHLLKKAGAR